MVEVESRPAAGSAPFLGVARSLTGRRWRERLSASAAQAALAIAQRHGLPDLVARVIAARGVGVDEVPVFLAPSLKALMPEPYGLRDMEAAATRLARAVTARERVAVFGDYDVDGAASAALLVRFLRWAGLDPRLYIPDRIFEGYGPNPEAVRQLAQEGATLLVTVDCGTSSFAALEEARRLGLDAIVLDHHQTDEALPPALALVNPNRQDDVSGLGHLCAAGVTFLALVATNRLLRREGFHGTAGEPPLLDWLELVALATICDVVPLTGLNRAYVAKGLAAMRRRRHPGLRALQDAAHINGPAGCYHCGFLLGPRINAGGRIGQADLGARLLASDDDGDAVRIAADLDRLNAERQVIEAKMLAEAIAEAEAALERSPGAACVVTASDRWHPGIVGLLASRLKDRFQRPAISIAFGPDGQGTGSGRSLPGVDLGRAVREAVRAGILVKGGGHAMAAGLTLRRESLARLCVFLEEALAEDVARACAADCYDVDGALSARGATPELVEAVERAGPFGHGNPAPAFAFPAHRVTQASVVGSGHVRALLVSPCGASLKAIAFRAADRPFGKALLSRSGRPFHVLATLEIDRWNGRERTQAKLLDVAAPDDRL